jgi:hypothetical protein
MKTGDQSSRGAALTSDDQIGKVMVVVSHDVRRCLVCEQLFTRRTASEHAKAACHPVS